MPANLTKGNLLFERLKAFFFDLDGCIYFSNVLADGAARLIHGLKNEGKQVGFITNNSRLVSQEVANKLKGMGLTIPPEDIFTATDYTGVYVMEKYGASRVKVIGSEGLSHALESAGHRVLPLSSREAADIVVVGRDTEFTYAKLALVAREVERGAGVIGANSDLYHPGSEGERVPETGSLIAAIEAVTGFKAAFAGKPEPHLFLYGMQAYGVSAQEGIMVGDNYDTDIIGGKQAGLYTAWIHAKAEQPGLKDEKPAADFIFPNLAAFLNACKL